MSEFLNGWWMWPITIVGCLVMGYFGLKLDYQMKHSYREDDGK